MIPRYNIAEDLGCSFSKDPRLHVCSKLFLLFRACKCDERCIDFGDCCFDWARKHFNETKFMNSAKTREYNCRNWFSNVSVFDIN